MKGMEQMLILTTDIKSTKAVVLLTDTINRCEIEAETHWINFGRKKSLGRIITKLLI